MSNPENPAVLHFHPSYRDIVLNGLKKTTIRWQTALTPGPVMIMFGDETTAFAGMITRREDRPLQELNDTDARNDGFADSDELLTQLQYHYPDLPPNAGMSILHFKVLPLPDTP